MFGRTTKQKIMKDILDLNSTTNPLGLIDIYRTLHPATAGHMFFSSTHEHFQDEPHSGP